MGHARRGNNTFTRREIQTLIDRPVEKGPVNRETQVNLEISLAREYLYRPFTSKIAPPVIDRSHPRLCINIRDNFT